MRFMSHMSRETWVDCMDEALLLLIIIIGEPE